jgi:hypothetical protein
MENCEQGKLNLSLSNAAAMPNGIDHYRTECS